jgi:hypothetical protein
MDEREATRAALTFPKVASWLNRYPPHPTTETTFDSSTRLWTVKA